MEERRRPQGRRYAPKSTPLFTSAWKGGFRAPNPALPSVPTTGKRCGGFGGARDKEMILEAFREALEKHTEKQIEKIVGSIEFETDIERMRMGY